MRTRFIVLLQLSLLLPSLALLPRAEHRARTTDVTTSATEDLTVTPPQETPTDGGTVYDFAQDIDAVSFDLGSPDASATMRAWNGTAWTEWASLEVETEFDPLLTESNMIMLPPGTRRIEISSAAPAIIHPIRVSHAPAYSQQAAQLMMRMPRILSRAEWGADPELLVKGPETARSDINDNGGENNAPAPSPSAKRVIDCNQAQRDYPSEFKTVKTVRTDEEGRKLRWTQQYSPEIKLLVVHHTALAVSGDVRPPEERVRALYAYHANGRGWGDIGYNFVIDETGQIYEGRAGGAHVVAGHAYCHNIGTLGISLLGNFELEKPSYEQIAALQWLLNSLSKTENIDVGTPVTFHGYTTPAIVGHGDLVSTTCPGYYLRGVLDQIRKNVLTGKMYAGVTYPEIASNYKDKTSSRRAERLASQPEQPQSEEGVTARGSTLLKGRPGTQTILSIRYEAGKHARPKGSAVASVKIPEGAGLWQDSGAGFERVRTHLTLGAPVPSGGTAQLRLKVQFPMENGRTNLQIGGITYVLETEGRLGRAAPTVPALETDTAPDVSLNRRPSRRTLTPRTIPVPAVSSASSSSRPRVQGRAALRDDGPDIRIRLSYTDAVGTLLVPPSTVVNNQSVSRGNLRFARDDENCTVSEDGKILGSGIVRIDTRGGISEITSWNRALNRFRGVLECRIVDGQLALINELPLEQYLRGLAEEPDTEPYEKQRAFAIAARSYAVYYINAEGVNRKFPGKPYDGSDDPAIFQKYSGVAFEDNNPHWLSAVDSTKLMVLQVDGETIKVPYFSQSNGRTLSPAEAGWRTFPHAEIFASKDDHWCAGMQQRGHGVGMSGCGAEAQAHEGKSGEEILEYYYPGAKRARL